MLTAPNGIAALLLLLPYLGVAFFPRSAAAWVAGMPPWAQVALPGLLFVPYLLITVAAGSFHWEWCALYALLPVTIAALLRLARRIDLPELRPPELHPPELPVDQCETADETADKRPDASPNERGTWLDFAILAALGLSVDLRWFERAWPPHMSIFNKVLLLDAGIYGFVLVRRLGGTGFDLRLRWRDAGIGLREAAFYLPIALALGLGLGFLHAHAVWRGVGAIAAAWIFTFFFIAVPEELFFRGWLQNILERKLKACLGRKLEPNLGRRLARRAALFITAALFGLSHFNKHTLGLGTTRFNWRYVVLAALAGVFYGRAWRRNRRVGAAAVTHATVDAIWSLWLR